jgi:DNA adenine methylase
MIPSSSIKMELVKPCLKWVGGKTQIITDVLNNFPKIITNYFEPFVGGGSVLFAFLSYVKAEKITVSGKVYVSDFNPLLIDLYKEIQSHPAKLILEVKQLRDAFNRCTGTTVNRAPTTLVEAMSSQESFYYWIRSTFNESPTSAMFLFLNKTCFRGVYREGPHGFNVPYGHYTNPSILDDDHIYTLSYLIKDVKFYYASFTESLLHPKAGDFVYLDPPYAPETATSFVGYTADGFDDYHATLFTMCHTLSKKGVKLLMSNADVKLVKDAFPDPPYTTTIISCKRSIDSKDPSKRTNEVLVKNF